MAEMASHTAKPIYEAVWDFWSKTVTLEQEQEGVEVLERIILVEDKGRLANPTTVPWKGRP